MINNMVPVLNRSLLISKVCNSDNMQTWSHINIHMDIMEYKMSSHSMQIHTLYQYPCLYTYGYYGVWSVSAFHVDPHSLFISIFMFIWILQTVCILCICIHAYIDMDIRECGVSPHSMQVDSRYGCTLHVVSLHPHIIAESER